MSCAIIARVHETSGLEKAGPMSAMKLQKLAYYSQAWSLVWDELPIFQDSIEAWANGPVCPRLYDAHRGCFQLARDEVDGKPEALTLDERDR